MKSSYMKPKVTVVSFKIEEGFTVSVNRVENDLMLFNFLSDEDNGRFGNSQFNNIGDDNSNYNFFGE